MPIFTDKVVLEDLGDLFLPEFKFRTALLDAPLSGFRLKSNGNGQHEFVSTDVTYKLPQKIFGSGSKITIQDRNNEILYDRVRVKKRVFSRAKEVQFKNLQKENVVFNDYFEKINCHLTYKQEEMEWILRGYVPIEMEDRIIMYTKDNRILIYSSWSGGQIFEAEFQRTFWNNYVIHRLFARKRKVAHEARDHILRFKQQIESQFLTHRHYIEKWSQEYYDRNKL
ncbi:MAG: hypothetical protein AAFP77_03395 [Bacteroidota bacterium]